MSGKEFQGTGVGVGVGWQGTGVAMSTVLFSE